MVRIGVRVQAGHELAGRYVLERLLGQGAVGEVWRAADRELGRAVAVKVIRERVADPKLAAGLLGEARIAGQLQHPGITVVHDAGEHEGQPFVVMELLRGRDLEAVLGDFPGGMPVDEAVSLGVQVADALAAAHAGGVVHRDLKPANLFVLEGGQLKICDFGIAVVSGATNSLASVSYVVGTPAYMSPEQCDGQDAGEPGDLYSLGCVLYALLTGRPPFAGRPPLAIMSQHRTTMPAGLRALRPAVPTGLDQLVVALLAKDPAARPGGAAQVAATLRALQGGHGMAGAEAGAGDRTAEIPDGQGRPPGSAGLDAAPLAAGRPATSVAVSSRQLLATAGDDGTARLWDPATGRQVGVLERHQRGISAVCTVKVGGRQFLATAGYDGTARLWDPETGQQVAVLEGHQRKIRAVCTVTVGGRQLLATAGDDGTARLWDPETGQQVAVLEGHRGRVRTACTVAIRGRPLLATGGSDGTARLWDPATGKQVVMEPPRARAWTTSVTRICPVTVDGCPLLAYQRGEVRLWDPAARQVTKMQGEINLPGENTITLIGSVTVGGRPLLATRGTFTAVRLWDPATGQQTIALRHSAYAVCSITVSSPGLS